MKSRQGLRPLFNTTHALKFFLTWHCPHEDVGGDPAFVVHEDHQLTRRPNHSNPGMGSKGGVKRINPGLGNGREYEYLPAECSHEITPIGNEERSFGAVAARTIQLLPNGYFIFRILQLGKLQQRLQTALVDRFLRIQINIPVVESGIEDFIEHAKGMDAEPLLVLQDLHHVNLPGYPLPSSHHQTLGLRSGHDAGPGASGGHQRLQKFPGVTGTRLLHVQKIAVDYGIHEIISNEFLDIVTIHSPTDQDQMRLVRGKGEAGPGRGHEPPLVHVGGEHEIIIDGDIDPVPHRYALDVLGDPQALQSFARFPVQRHQRVKDVNLYNYEVIRVT